MKHDGLMVATAVSSPPGDGRCTSIRANQQQSTWIKLSVRRMSCAAVCADHVSTQIQFQKSRQMLVDAARCSHRSHPIHIPVAYGLRRAQFLSECIFHTRRRDLKASGAVNLLLLLLLRALLQGSLRPIICALSRSFIKKNELHSQRKWNRYMVHVHDAFELQN